MQGRKREVARRALVPVASWMLLVSIAMPARGQDPALPPSGGAVDAGIVVPGGAILTMLADTMLPEAVDHAGPLVGVVAALGFTVAFLISAG